MTDKYGTLALLHAASTYVRQWTIVFPVLNLSVCVVAAIRVDTSTGSKIQNTNDCVPYIRAAVRIKIPAVHGARVTAAVWTKCYDPGNGGKRLVPGSLGPFNFRTPSHRRHPDNMLSTHAHIFRSS